MLPIVEIYGFNFTNDILIEIERKVGNATRKWETLNFALWAHRIEEMEESASHHFKTICFAQLRAEMAENDAGEARRLPEIIRNPDFPHF